MSVCTYSEPVETAKTYYDSKDADEFYYNVWGGEDIHIGLYKNQQDDIRTASKRTVMYMAEAVNKSSCKNKVKKVLDIGSGYGGAARYLAAEYGWNVTCLNLSEVENNRNREKNKKCHLDHLITVREGSFESLPFEDNSFDLVWSEDALLHSGNKEQVFQEVKRVLRPEGEFIFTDPMQSDNCPDGVLGPVLARIHLDQMGSFSFYQDIGEKKGLHLISKEDLTRHLVTHYARVAEETQANYKTMCNVASKDYIDRMLTGLQHWVEAGKNGYLSWGILHFKRPAAA
jgi:sarcosine/dimethylglycine N-methyltransferase